MAQIPDPSSYAKLHDWAKDVFRYLQEQQDTMQPRPVMLSNLQALDKATQNGIVQFDAENERIVVSVDGAWEPLAFLSDT